MATYIKTLKEDNGDITYPQTKAGAVLLNNGSDLETELSQYVTAEDIASTSALTSPVQTNMIADGAVTKAVTLKNNNNEEIYPVTDISLVNGNITTGRIADNAITTPKIADNSVTADKIDWTTLERFDAINATTINQGDSSWNGVIIPNLSYTTKTAGVFLCIANGNIQSNGSGRIYPRIGIYKGTDRDCYSAVSCEGGEQASWSVSNLIICNAGDQLSVRISVDGSNAVLFEGQKFQVIQISRN